MKTKTAQHTLGKYVFWKNGDIWDEIKSQKIATVNMMIGEAEANGNLLAAAPETAAERDRLKEINAELLEAAKTSLDTLKHAIIFFKYQRPGHEFYPNRESAEANIARLESIIAKADGIL